MTVNIDPSEVRAGTSAAPAPARSRLGLPPRTILVSGLCGTALIAFTVGAFSFFSTLADPRVRKPRPMPAAASMPDLKDGMPELVDGGIAGPAQRAATLNLPRPVAAEPAAPEPRAAEQAAVPPAIEQLPVEQATSQEPASPEPHGAGVTPLPIQNAATVPETRTATVVAPPARPVATIAPARAETVKAKPVQASAVAAPKPSAEPDFAADPASTATVPAPAQPPRKPVAAKPPVQKTAARKAPTKTVADAAPDAAPVAASAAAEDNEVPGAKQFRAGVKAISGIFGGDAKDE